MRRGVARLLRAGLTTGLTLGLLALTLILAACGGAATNSAHTQVNAPKAATQTSSSKAPTPTQGVIPHLNWRTVTTPIDLSHGGVSMEASPVNGRDAWICGDGAAAGQFIIWRTQDAGATWQQVSTLSPVAPPPTVLSTSCNVIPDQNLATSLAVWLPTNNSSAPGSTSSALAYYSSDSGVTWTQMPQNWWINQLATSGDTTYALVNDLGHQGNVNVFASSDHFNTWRSINPTTQEEEQNPPVLWVTPNSGEALLFVNYFNKLYHSTDGGSHWTLTTAQSNQSAVTQLAVWRGQSTGWLLCGSAVNGPPQMLCSTDLGKTWTNALSAGLSSSCSSATVTSNGDIYVSCNTVLYRLTPGASAWSPVGQAPNRYVTMSQSGQVWCEDGSGATTYVLDQLP